MNKRTTPENLAVGRLLHPASAYVRPADVLRDTDLTTNESAPS